jgi:F-type H+-transporting ATPase subunit delta
VRQLIRGYADGVIEQTESNSLLSQTAAELAGFRDLLDQSQDLRRALLDPGVPAASRRGLISDLLARRVGPTTLRLVTFAIDSDRAIETVNNIRWLTERVDAAAHQMQPTGETTLGHKAAEERVDGYATAILGGVSDRSELGEVEDELFRFLRIAGGSDELRGPLSDRAVPAEVRKGLVTDLLSGRATPTTVSLAAYATQVGRPRDYLELLDFLVARVAAERSRRLAEVRSAVDLDDRQRGNLADALSRVIGHVVDVRVTVDPTVLGGFVATIGDTVVDGSVRRRLDLIRERLVLPEATVNRGEPN